MPHDHEHPLRPLARLLHDLGAGRSERLVKFSNRIDEKRRAHIRERSESLLVARDDVNRNTTPCSSTIECIARTVPAA